MALIAAGETITDASGKLGTGRIADNAVDTDQLADDAVGSAEIGENIEFTGNYLKIPSGDTAGRPLGAAGIVRYNTTTSSYEQYDPSSTLWVKWAELQPTITSLTYPGDDTALDTAGSQTLIIAGTNFEGGLTVTIDGTAPSSVSLDSSIQITCTGTPAKSAGTKTNGVVVTSQTGLTASTDVEYSAVPAWQTAADLGDELDETTISTITVAATDATSYALKAGSSLPSGLSLASGGAITGNLSGNNNADYNFYIVATDAQNQTSERQFTLGIADSLGGIISSHGNYRVHTFLESGTLQLGSSKTAVAMIVGGGGGAGGQRGGHGGAGGGGAGGVVIDSDTLSAGSYSVVVGLGGNCGTLDVDNPSNGSPGGDSTYNSLTAGGGGGGANNYRYSNSNGSAGRAANGSGGGAGYDGYAGNASGGAGNGSGNAGGGLNTGADACGGGGGGAGGAGGTGGNSSWNGGAGGAGISNNYRTGNNQTYAQGGHGGHSMGAPGTANTGNGGYGGYGGTFPDPVPNGGSGIVVIMLS